MSMLRIPFLVVTFLVLCGSAGAGTAKAAKATVFGSRDQLRECLDLDDGMKVRRHAVEAATADHDKRFDANEAEDARLAESKAKLDRNDKGAIQAFNKAVQEHQQHTQEINEQADAAEAMNKSYEADKQAMDDKCGNLTYRPTDIDAVSKERKKAASVSAATAASAP
jgi:hypothetical protein